MATTLPKIDKFVAMEAPLEEYSSDDEAAPDAWKDGFIDVQTLGSNVTERLSSTAVFCPVCGHLSRNLRIFSLPREDLGSKVVFFKWPVLLEELVSAVESGCQLCSFMAVRFFQPFKFYVMSGDSPSQDIACCGHSSMIEKSEAFTTAMARLREFTEKHPKTEVALMVYPHDRFEPDYAFARIVIYRDATNLTTEGEKELMGVEVGITLEIYAQKGNPSAEDIRMRPVNINYDSDESVQKARTWIERCLHDHPYCPDLENSVLPSRVVEIVDEVNLRLAEGNKPGVYTALSYCWGRAQEFSTTSTTLDERRRGFKLSDLPQTLADAVRLTRRLGQNFIWIDSLCIIQDSESDQANELPLMAQYYATSYVTICAAGSSCDDGFFKTQGECEQHSGYGLAKDLLRLPYLCLDGAVGEVYFREEMPYILAWEPISFRAWTLQERLLSPRILFYGLRLVWMCSFAQRSDGGVEDWTYDIATLDHCGMFNLLINAAYKAAQFNVGNSPKETNITYDLSSIWYQIVHEYSRRCLTVPNDKLPAIAGLASFIQEISGDDYLAGLWRNQLLRQLMWSTFPELRLIQPQQWRAPSWSWASIDNDITFERLPPEHAIEVAQLVSCSTKPRYENVLLGEISEAVLEINAPVLEDQGGFFIETLQMEYRPPSKAVKTGNWMREFMMNLDEKIFDEVAWEAPDVCFFLVLFAQPTTLELNDSQVSNEDSAIASGLILTKLEGNKYRRIASLLRVQIGGLSIWIYTGRLLKLSDLASPA